MEAYMDVNAHEKITQYYVTYIIKEAPFSMIPQTPNKNDGKSACDDVTERKFKLDLLFS